MSDTPLNKEGSKLPSDIDLSIDINPEMYANSKPHPSYDKFYKAAEYATEQADYKATSEENGQKGFVTAKADGMMAGVYDWIRCIIFAIAIVVIVLTFVFRLVDVEGTSMCDTLQTKDKVIVTNLLYTPRDNDIVVISHGAEYKKPIIKRVIATEGQTLELDYENEKIIVDGIEISEPYIKGTTFSGNYGNNAIPSVIPEGKIFVMGDNRQVSLDSRSTEIGLIDVKDVIGKAQVVAFPFDHFGYLY
nr:signal peptidase I [Ruminococcus sp.]